MAFEDEPAFPEDPGLSWSQLRAFSACAHHRSFSTAAAALGLTTSAVRYQIALLEHRLRCRLFERRGGSLSLTEVGASFAQKIEAPMRALMTACAAVTSSAQDEAFTLTAPPLFARHFLFAPALLQWCDAHRVKLDITDTKRDLLSQGSLAAIRLAAADHPDLLSVKLLSVSVIIAAAPSIARDARPADPAWWADQMLISSALSEAGWPLVWSALGLSSSPKPLRAPAFSSYAAALEAAASGYGIILAPLPFANTELAAGRLRQISSVRVTSKHAFSLVMRKDAALSTRGRALRQRLVHTMAARADAK